MGKDTKLEAVDVDRIDQWVDGLTKLEMEIAQYLPLWMFNAARPSIIYARAQLHNYRKLVELEQEAKQKDGV